MQASRTQRWGKATCRRCRVTGIGAVSLKVSRGSCHRHGAGLGAHQGEAEDTVKRQHVAAGAGLDQHQEKGHAHTQRVLDVDQPAIETEKLGDQDQLVRHCPVRALVPSQEGFTQLPTFLPLGDESACGSGEKRVRRGNW